MLKGNIRVFCRVRPVAGADKAAADTLEGGQPVVTFPQSGTAHLSNTRPQVSFCTTGDHRMHEQSQEMMVLLHRHLLAGSDSRGTWCRRGARHLPGAHSSQWNEEQLHI